jgi:hypothetical protein
MQIQDEIADLFNHVYQSHRDSDPMAEVLADLAERMAAVFAQRGYGTVEVFADVASMSGLVVGVGGAA